MELLGTKAKMRVGEHFPFSFSQEMVDAEFGGRTLRFAEPLEVTGAFWYDGGAYLVEGELQTALTVECASCAAAFRQPFFCEFSERFVKASERGEDEESYAFTDDTLPLGQAVMDNLFLKLPLVSRCRPDCKGLCPVCGANRNEVACGCERAEKKQPFASLANIQLEDNE